MSGIIININNISNKVRNTVLTGLNTALTGTIAATDTVLQAFGKLQNQISNFTTGFYAQTASSTPITNTTTETTLLDGGVGTLTVPANTFKVGDSFRVVMGGHISAVNNNTIHIRIKRNGTVLLADTGVITLPTITGKNWELTVTFTIRKIGVAGVAEIASHGSFVYNKDSGLQFEGRTFSVVNNTNFDTTISNTLNITAEWGAANAGNSIYSDTFVLSKVY